jgi:hypothetical protein
MPTFAPLVKRLKLAKRTTQRILATRTRDLKGPRGQGDVNQACVVPLPLELSDRIPQELYQIILEQVGYDQQTLMSCSLVCRAWFPVARCCIIKTLALYPCLVILQGASIKCSTPTGESLQKFVTPGLTCHIFISLRWNQLRSVWL